MAIFRLGFAAVSEARRRHVSVSQPFLHFGDVGLVRKRIGGGCPHGMDTQPVHLDMDAGCMPILDDDVAAAGRRQVTGFEGFAPSEECNTRDGEGGH